MSLSRLGGAKHLPCLRFPNQKARFSKACLTAFSSMKVSVIDPKLCKHSVDVDNGASVAHVKRLLADMSLVPAGFVPKLVYQQRMLGDNECIGSIGYNPERSISLVCLRLTPESTASDPELHSPPPTEPNTSTTAQQAPAPPRPAANADSAAADMSSLGLSQPRPVIFSMGFDEALVQRALAQTGGDEQGAVDVLISGQLHLDESFALSSPRDACLPVIFSMGFDDALVRRALARAGGEEQRAVELLLSGRITAPSSVRPMPSPQFCRAVFGRMSAAPWCLKKGNHGARLSSMGRKDQLTALCGVVAGRLVVRPSMSGGVSGATAQRMMTWIAQRVAAMRAAATLEGALLAERLCWDGPMRHASIEKSAKKVICLQCLGC
jgi:hypothetical protein